MQSLSDFEHGFIEALYESDDIGLALVDSDLRYIRVNETLAEINGVSAAEHEGKSVREVLPEFAPMLEPLLNRVLESREPIIDLEISGPTPADPNADRHFHGGYYPIVSDGEVIGVAALVLEVTEKVRAQRALMEQAREVYENVVQLLSVAQLALDEEQIALAYRSVQHALTDAKTIASKVLVEEMVDRA